MKAMRLDGDSSGIALLVFFVAAYPFMFAADVFAWPRGVQLACGLFGWTVLTGTKLALIVRERRRSGGRRHPPR
jgi:hypothetical protein